MAILIEWTAVKLKQDYILINCDANLDTEINEINWIFIQNRRKIYWMCILRKLYHTLQTWKLNYKHLPIDVSIKLLVKRIGVQLYIYILMIFYAQSDLFNEVGKLYSKRADKTDPSTQRLYRCTPVPTLFRESTTWMRVDGRFQMQTKHFAAGLINVNRHPIVMEVHWKVLHGPAIPSRSWKASGDLTVGGRCPPTPTNDQIYAVYRHRYPTQLRNFLTPVRAVSVFAHTLSATIAIMCQLILHGYRITLTLSTE